MYICIFSRSQQFSATFCSLMDETEANRYGVTGCIAHGTANLYPLYLFFLYGPQTQLADTFSNDAPMLVFRQ